MKTLYTSALIMAFVITSVAAAYATDYYVDGINGDDANSGLSPDEAFKTITYALEVIQPSEDTPATVSVAAGTYSASTNGEAFPLPIRSHLALVGNDPETTLLDAEKRAGISVISCNRVSSVTISNLGIINAASEPALKCISTHLFVRGCHFRNNEKGSIICDGVIHSAGHIAIESSLFVGNGGVCVDVCTNLYTVSQGVVMNSTFLMNTGCLFASTGDLTASECLIQENEARVYDKSGGNLLIEKTIIRGNVSDDSLFLGGPSVVRDCVIEGNTSNGALFGTRSACVIRNCVIDGNTSGESIFYLESGGWFISYYMGRLVVEDSLIARNVPESGSLICTKAYYLMKRCPAVVTRTPLMDDQEQIELRRSTIVGNGPILARRRGERQPTTTSSDGLPVQDCIFSDNTVRFDVHWSNMEGYYSVPYNIDHSCLQEEFEGEGNFVADPMFVSGPLGDYYLSSVEAGQDADSPCMDAGSTSASIAGVNWRTTRTDGEFDTGTVDIGYHYSATPPTIDCFVSAGHEPLHPGDALSASMSVENGGLPVWVDVYAGFILPNGSIYCVSPEGLTTDLVPWAATSHLPTDFASLPIRVFEAQIPGSLPEGTYVFAAALSLTGAFRPVGDIAFTQFTIGS